MFEVVYNRNEEDKMIRRCLFVTSFLSVIVSLFVSCAPPGDRPALTLPRVPESFPVVEPIRGLPDPGATYGIIVDMDGDGKEEWLLVYFAGTSEDIDTYALVLYSKESDRWVRKDYLLSTDPALPEYFRTAMPDLPPKVEFKPDWIANLPAPRGEGWTGSAAELWKHDPVVCLPFAEVDGTPGMEVLVPLTGFKEWTIAVVALRAGRLELLEDVTSFVRRGIVDR